MSFSFDSFLFLFYFFIFIPINAIVIELFSTKAILSILHTKVSQKFCNISRLRLRDTHVTK